MKFKRTDILGFCFVLAIATDGVGDINGVGIALGRDNADDV
jgi:hypothetical protein